MASGNIDYTKIISQSYENIKNLLDNRTNVADPADPTGDKKFVYTREPDQKALGFAGYPYIIVPMPAADHVPPKSLDGRKRQVEWEIKIEVHCSDRGGAEGSSKGAEHLREIADDIIQILSDKTNRNTLRGYGMANIMPNFEPLDPTPIHKELVFMGRMIIPFSKYMTVSA